MAVRKGPDWLRAGLVLLLVTLLVGSGCMRNSGGSKPPISPSTGGTWVTVVLYFADQQAQYVVPEEREVQQGDEATTELVVRELMAGPDDPYLNATIPAGTKLLGVEVMDGVAYVNFSKEFRDNCPGGSASELMTLDSLVYSLTELPEVEKVQILIDGARQDVLAGHATIAEPLERHGIKTYPIFLDAQRAAYLQEKADGGEEVWRLDPVEVAKRDGRMLGFRLSDQFELEELVPQGSGSGSGEALVRAVHGEQRYLLQLVQPVKTGEGGIWMLNSVREEI